jgi:hypothetical protein
MNTLSTIYDINIFISSLFLNTVTWRSRSSAPMNRPQDGGLREYAPVNEQITTKTCCCVRRLSSETRVKQFEDVINRLPVSEYHQRLLLARFLTQVEYFEKWTYVANCRYNACRIIIGIGSMTLPSIQSIQSSENIEGYERELFWISVFLSIMVLIANSFIGLFSLDQKYHQYKSTLEQLNSAGWIYFELSGKYQLMSLNHQTGIVEFFNEIETIKRMMYQTEDKANTSRTTTESMPVSLAAADDHIGIYDQVRTRHGKESDARNNLRDTRNMEVSLGEVRHPPQAVGEQDLDEQSVDEPILDEVIVEPISGHVLLNSVHTQDDIIEPDAHAHKTYSSEHDSVEPLKTANSAKSNLAESGTRRGITPDRSPQPTIRSLGTTQC